MDGVEIDGLLSALHTAAALLLFLSIVGTALVALHYLDAWKEGRGLAGRKRHFGGV